MFYKGEINFIFYQKLECLVSELQAFDLKIVQNRYLRRFQFLNPYTGSRRNTLSSVHIMQFVGRFLTLKYLSLPLTTSTKKLSHPTHKYIDIFVEN